MLFLSIKLTVASMFVDVFRGITSCKTATNILATKKQMERNNVQIKASTEYISELDMRC